MEKKKNNKQKKMTEIIDEQHKDLQINNPKIKTIKKETIKKETDKK